MNALTLQWYDAGQNHTQQIYEQQPSKNPGTIRIGRDPNQCDIVLTNPTVSGLHVEVFFDAQQQSFQIRNLRPQNPPLVDGQQLTQGERPLQQGSTVYLGQLQLQVTAINMSAVAATIIAPTQPQAHQTGSATRPLQPQPQPQAHQQRPITAPVHRRPATPPPPQPQVNQQRPATPPAPPRPPVHQHQPVTPPAPPRPPVHQHQPATPPVRPAIPPQGTYGLECPKCHKVSPLENLQVGCPWCGTSLAAAVSVLVTPGS